jgi:hypothetical protein
MPEPTIDEMLKYLKGHTSFYGADPMRDSICAILEQHRNIAVAQQEMMERKLAPYKARVELVAIRAFVERVEKRAERDGKGYDNAYAVEQELAAIEQGG